MRLLSLLLASLTLTASALAAARSGWRVALIERAPFPRHKVCGDCLNPGVWPVLESLGTAAALRALDNGAGI